MKIFPISHECVKKEPTNKTSNNRYTNKQTNRLVYFERRALFSLQVAFLKSPSQVTKIYFPSTKLIYLKYNFDTFKNIENFTYQKADAESSLKACFHE